MPKVYILPEMNVTDRNVRGTINPHTENNYKKLGGYWSIFEYYMYNYGTLELGEPNGISSMLPAVPKYTFTLDGKIIKTMEQLRSFDVESGKHSLKVNLSLEVSNDFSKPGLYESFAEKTVYKTYYFDKTIDFNIESGNAFFVLSLSYNVFYPLLCGNQFVMGGKGEGRQGTSVRYFHEFHTKNIKNAKCSFEQVDLNGMRARLARHVKYVPYFIVSRNEPLPSEDGVTNLNSNIVKSQTNNYTNSQPISSVKPSVSNARANITKPVASSTNGSGTTLSIKEQAKAQGKTIAQFIGDRPEPIKPRKRIVKKEVIVKEKYYDSEKFEESMDGFEYHVSGDEVILTKVLKSCAELIIPDGVTVIKENALGNYLDSEIIKIPYSLKVLEKGAFKSNTHVQKVVLESQIDTIEEETFMDCKNLQEVILPPTVKSIKSRAFQGAKIKSIFIRPDILVEKDAFDENVIIDDGSLSKKEKENLVIDGFITELLAINPKKGEFVSKLQRQLKSVEEKESQNFEVFKAKKEQEFIENKENYIASEKIKTLQNNIKELELQIDALSKN